VVFALTDPLTLRCMLPQPCATEYENMGGERRKNPRVGFERGIEVYLMAIDGTWRRECTMQDVGENGAKLAVRGSIEGLNLKEFFLLLSSTGPAYRRCELSWVNGDLIGAKFVLPSAKKKQTTLG
jgi:hypothetical protein